MSVLTALVAFVRAWRLRRAEAAWAAIGRRAARRALAQQEGEFDDR